MQDALWDWFRRLLDDPPSSVWQWAFIYLGSLGGIVLTVLRGSSMLTRRLWPPRPGKASWHAAATPLRIDESELVDLSRTNADNAWMRDRMAWTHGREMRPKDAYTLHLDKPRVVSMIRLHSEGNRYPETVKFSVLYRNSRIVIEERAWDSASLSIPLNPPRKIEGFEIEIVEPRKVPIGLTSGNPPAWSIYNIEIEEVRLFGRYWRRQIL